MRRNTTRIVLLATAITGVFLAAGFSKPTSKTPPCDESMEQCCKKKEKKGTDNMIWETLSGQFFTATGLN